MAFGYHREPTHHRERVICPNCGGIAGAVEPPMPLYGAAAGGRPWAMTPEPWAIGGGISWAGQGPTGYWPPSYGPRPTSRWQR